MSKCQELKSIWFITYLVIINLYLIVISIKDYFDFKKQLLDQAFGASFNVVSVHMILFPLIISMALFPIIVYMNIVPQNNLANDGHVLGRDPDKFRLAVDEQGRRRILPLIDKGCITNPNICLIFMELPPLSCLLHAISAMGFLIPKSYMEGLRIRHGVLGQNHIWHSDLDLIFDPDWQHPEFIHYPNICFTQPLSVAYFNLGLALVLLSLQYAKVLWHVSKQFAIILSFAMIFWSFHVLIEYCSISVMVKISINPGIVNENIQLTISESTIIILTMLGNLISLFSFITIFHYGVLQYADLVIHKHCKNRRQILSGSPPIIESNNLDIPAAFSFSISENNYSERSFEPVFSRSHWPHMIALLCLGLSMGLKSTNLYLSCIHLYGTTSDILTIVNMVTSCLFLVFWLILWFAFALRRTWNFEIKPDPMFANKTSFHNGNSIPNHSGQLQFHQDDNFILPNAKLSDLNLSKQDMMTVTRNIGLDGYSDDTDMSSRLSSNNYVFLQSARNGQLGLIDSGAPLPTLRSPLYLSYCTNTPGVPINNGNVIYANDNSIYNRSVQLDDQLGSEHSFNSCPSRNIAFESMPPILPNFDENRYKNPNPIHVAMEKLIPRYLRHQSLDYNNLAQYSIPNNEFNLPARANSPMSYTFDNGVTNHNGGTKLYRHSSFNYPFKPVDRYSTLQNTTKSSMEHIDSVAMDGFEPRRGIKPMVMCPTLEESITDNMATESDCLLPKPNNEQSGNGITELSLKEQSESNESNNNGYATLVDRMCSQV